MSTQTFEVVDGPLRGERYALQLTRDNREIRLRCLDGRVAVYTARLDFYKRGLAEVDGSHQASGFTAAGLWFVGYEAPLV